MAFVRYNGQVAVIVQSGSDLMMVYPDSGLDDHLGLWFGEMHDDGRPVVYTIPKEYVDQAEAVVPVYRH